MELPTHSLHLLLPLAASLLFVLGLLNLKRASAHGVGPWTATFVSNLWAGLLFSTLALLGGPGQPWYRLWQPATIAVLYLVGQVSTFWALHRGDVSIATPLLSVKVLLVAVLLAVVGDASVGPPIWCAAGLATLGIVLIQRSDRQEQHRHVALTVCFALVAAASFAMFDVLVQRWTPAWGAGRMLPWIFGIATVMSLGFLPLIDGRGLTTREGRRPLVLGGLLIALQAVCIVFTIGTFGDAARVNIVYTLRGLWGVLLSWQLAHWFAIPEAQHTWSVMAWRLLGAVLVTVAVVLAIASGLP